MSAQLNRANKSLLVILVTILLLSIAVLAQENCEKASVQEALRLWTNEVGDDSACPPEAVKKLIEYYKDMRQSKRANGKCRQAILTEARNLIVSQVADVMHKAVTEPEKAKELPALVQQLGGDDGLLESVIDTAYWSLALVDQQTKLPTVITKVNDVEQKLKALLELDRLASANNENVIVEEIKKHVNQVEEQPIAQTNDKIKNLLTTYKKKIECMNKKPNLTLQYPPVELQEKIKKLSDLQKSCSSPSQVSQSLADLEKKSIETWSRCYAKINYSINERAKIVTNKALLLDSTLQSMQENCARPSGMQVSNNNLQVTNFQNVLKEISRIC